MNSFQILMSQNKSQNAEITVICYSPHPPIKMSFIDLFGGHWTPKEPKPSPEMMEKREKQAVLLQYPQHYIEKLQEHFKKRGPRPTACLKDNGDESYSWGLGVCNLINSCFV